MAITKNTLQMNDRARRMQHLFDVPLIIAAILTLPFLLLQDGSGHGVWHITGYVGSILVWILFVVETIVMLSVVDSRRAWLMEHPLDIAIIILTPPVVSSSLQGLRALRILRLLRVLEIMPAISRLMKPSGLRFASVLALIVLVISAEAFHSTEKVSYGNSLYWAVTTMTTVGYGDISPHTTVGKVVACLVMLVGIGFFAILTGAIAQQFLSKEVAKFEDTEVDLVAKIRAISDELHSLEEQARRQLERSTSSGATSGTTGPHERL